MSHDGHRTSKAPERPLPTAEAVSPVDETHPEGLDPNGAFDLREVSAIRGNHTMSRVTQWLWFWLSGIPLWYILIAACLMVYIAFKAMSVYVLKVVAN